MRQVLAIPYKMHLNECLNRSVPKIFHYPVREKLYTPELKGIWTDVKGEADNFCELKMQVHERCRAASKQNPRRFAIGSDHSLTYSLLVEDDVEQVVVMDRHSDGAVYYNCEHVVYSNRDLNCGTWGNLLIKYRPDIRYILFCQPFEEALLFVKESGAGTKESRSSFVPKKDIPQKLGDVLENRKTALSFCADCSPVFRSRYQDYPKLLELQQIPEIIKTVSERTELKHIDLMEISLRHEQSVKAARSVMEAALRL
jgi:hypothetical protein